MRATAVIVLLLWPAVALAWPGKVLRVDEGDVLTVVDEQSAHITVRLYGIAAPAWGQSHAVHAAEHTRRLAAHQPVDVREFGLDDQGRLVALVTLAHGPSLNADLVANGWAWVDQDECRSQDCAGWLLLEEKAREEHLGLWLDEHPIPPAEWRARHIVTNGGPCE